ncbi:hypothetical protein VTK26DRAFT_5674 [Humicola hyalothermophila]
MNPEDLFQTLAEQYNTVPYNIQDRVAFHHDVSDAAHEAKNLDEFHKKLAIRRAERLQELLKAWNSVTLDAILEPGAMSDDKDRLNAFINFTQNPSWDTLILFINSLIPRPQAPPAPPIQDPSRHATSTAPGKAADEEAKSTDGERIDPPGTAACGYGAEQLRHPLVDSRHGHRETQNDAEGERRNRAGERRSRRRKFPEAPPSGTGQSSVPSTLTRNAGVTKRRAGRPPKPTINDGDAVDSNRQSSHTRRQQQRPPCLLQPKASGNIRASRRLAGKPPEYSISSR